VGRPRSGRGSERMKLFRQIAIWSRLDDRRAVRFNCIEDMSVNKFVVQTSDYFYIPIKNEHLSYFDKLFPERFIEVDRSECKWFDSVEEAIAAHDLDFR
jgi:hypothetical protein